MPRETLQDGAIHYWWLSDEPSPDKPWSRTMCDREQESRFAEGATGTMTTDWEKVTCGECLARID